MIKKMVSRYAHFVSHHSYIMLLIVLLITGASVFGMSQLGTKSMDNKDILPTDLEVIKAYNMMSDDFGGDASLMFSIEIDPQYSNSSEPRDVRDPKIIKYIDTLTKIAGTHAKVRYVASPSTVLRAMSNGDLPQTQSDINSLSDNPLMGQYISSDYTIALIKMQLSNVDKQEDQYAMVDDAQKMIEDTTPPAGINVNVAGSMAQDPEINKLISPEMEATSQFAFIGIVIILIILFRSFRYSLSPLSLIFIGIMWAMGFMGFTGVSLSAQTSGVISMIMGIGIDFGIQMITRFREELAKSKAEEAMEITLNNVFIPMATTTLAALIGFKAMSWGQLTFFGEFGYIMSLGIAACFLAAITIIPPVMILGDGLFAKIKSFAGSAGNMTTLFNKKVIR